MTPTDNSSPVDVVKTFIAFVKTKDVESMRNLIHPKATACLIRENEPRFKLLTETIDTLEETKDMLEEASWDEVERINGEYATVWTNFSMHRDGEVSDILRGENSTNPIHSFTNWDRVHIHVGKALI